MPVDFEAEHGLRAVLADEDRQFAAAAAQIDHVLAADVVEAEMVEILVLRSSLRQSP
ncbi:MAG: hypothetical protein VW547_06675 [Alphaproteobacteria bacterium]